MATPPKDILLATVHIGGADKPFGEFTLEDVRARSSELRAATGWGPTARIAPVARAWSDLARRMEQAGVATVSALDAASLAEVAGGLWVVPPGGSLLP